MSIYLPRASFSALFAIAAALITKNENVDPQLQKKAYKLIPRLAQSELGKIALSERNSELQQLLLDAADAAVPPSRRDRMIAVRCIVEVLPTEDLYFIPAILPEVVIATRESNEKARQAAFTVLVAMGEKMKEGGTIKNSKVPHMPTDAPDARATIDEYFTMVSAGLAGASPHGVSASITSLTRILYEFHASLSETALAELVETLDVFLLSPNREIVRSVLGFVKVCVVSLPDRIVRPRLGSLLPKLMIWSKEHKAHFRAKVKHLVERLLRRFGAEEVEKRTPEEDRKLIANIRKTRERRKRKNKGTAVGEDENSADEGREGRERRKGAFESEFDEAVYGSADEDEELSSQEGSDDEVSKKRTRKRAQKDKEGTYILEDEDEPLDLLDKRTLGRISSSKPLKNAKQVPAKKKAKVNVDGKLVIGVDDDSDADGGVDMEMQDIERGEVSLEQGINAYVDAIRGRDAARRGQRGKLKFDSGQGKRKKGDDDMDVDENDGDVPKKSFGNGKRVLSGRIGKQTGSGSGRGAGKPVAGRAKMKGKMTRKFKG